MQIIKRFLDLRTVTVFAAVLIVLLLNAYFSRRNTDLLIESKDIVAHTWQVKLRLETIRATINEAAIGQRGFLVTGEDAYLQTYRSDLQKVDALIADVQQFTSDNPYQTQQIPLLRQAIQAWTAPEEQNIALRRRHNMGAVAVQLRESKARMEEILAQLGLMGAEEDRLLADRQKQAATSATVTQQTFLVATVVAVIAVMTAYILIHRLLLERERREQEVREHNLELEQRVAERTASLEQTNSRLEQSNGRLEEANRELEAFSYSVSHDLRAPLRHIGGFAELLQKSSAATLDEKGMRYVRTIHESAKHAGTLVDDLLTFSRMGRTELRRGNVQMEQLIEEIRRDLAAETEGRTIEWKIAPLPPVQGDAAMLRLVWQNLIGNAVKYTKPRLEAHIEIGCRTEEDGYNVFFIRDDGVGFDMRYVDKLFGVFQRLHSKEQFEGTGIGLANVRRIVQRHGGKTWAEGELDHGATFWFTLPQKLPQEGNPYGSETNSAGGG